MENSRIKQCMSLKFCIVLSTEMKSPTIPVHPAWDMNYPFYQHIHAVYAPQLLVTSYHLTYQTTITVLLDWCLSNPHFTY